MLPTPNSIGKFPVAMQFSIALNENGASLNLTLLERALLVICVATIESGA